MDTLVASLQPARQEHDEEGSSRNPSEWGSMAGFGNLDRTGAVDSMLVPGVPDVSGFGTCGLLQLASTLSSLC